MQLDMFVPLALLVYLGSRSVQRGPASHACPPGQLGLGSACNNRMTQAAQAGLTCGTGVPSSYS